MNESHVLRLQNQLRINSVERRHFCPNLRYCSYNCLKGQRRTTNKLRAVGVPAGTRTAYLGSKVHNTLSQLVRHLSYIHEQLVHNSFPSGAKDESTQKFQWDK